jgi:hypothetical protein
VEYTVTETRIEAEALTFAAQGVIRTADGREIAFAVSMERAHLEVETSQVTVRVGTPPAPKDPLLLDLDGLARLTGESTPFDLDGDGVDDALPTLAGGAWLSFDVDADGVIRSREELFGPASGDGFADLARLDDDGNGWIDEGDAAWSRLGLFDGAGFTALSDAGVGALSLTHADGDFTERVGGEAVARTRATGVYLTEAGAAGTIRQVDVLG